MDPFLHGPIFSILGLYGNMGVSRERIILEYSGPSSLDDKKKSHQDSGVQVGTR